MKDFSATSENDAYRLAFETAAAPILVVDHVANVKLANRSVLQMLGLEANNVIGQPVERFLKADLRGANPEDRPGLLRAFIEAVSSQERTATISHRDGSRTPVSVKLSTTDATKSDTIVCCLSPRVDHATRVQDLEKQLKNLAAMNQDLSWFAYGASHDLKAPLASIIGLLSFCNEDLNEGNLGELGENLTLALQLCYKAADRIDAVFEVASVGQQSFPVEDVRLEALIQDVWHEHVQLNDNNSELSLEIGHRDPVRTERATLRLIFETLFSNALKFRSNDGNGTRVTARTSMDRHVLNLTVADNGTGIPEDRQRDVFKMFRDIDTRSGNGRGLALLQRHVARLHGKISFTSVEGQGTEFNVELPINSASSV